MSRFLRFSRASQLALAGMLIGIAGLIIQTIADPAKFAEAEGQFRFSFPPGILFILAAAALMIATNRWWWHPIFGVLIAVWIVGLGTLAGKLTPNLVSPNLGTVIGTIVMAAGLVLTALAGLYSMIAALRTRTHVPATRR
jgi:hypothetical protein